MNFSMQSLHIKQAGFTLVELAITMVIIGLLIGGVLKAQQLVNNAEITHMIASLNNIKQAELAFEQEYGALPGDLQNPSRMTRCAAGNVNNCTLGNNDDLIAHNPADVTLTRNVDLESESVMYWKHLAIGNYITKVEPDAPAAVPADYIRDVTHPSIYKSTVLNVLYVQSEPPLLQSRMVGNIYRLQRAPIGADAGQGLNAIEPVWAQSFDLKIDDGEPDTGHIQAGSPGSLCNDGGVYQVNERRENCILYIKWE